MNKQQIRQLALANGFKLKLQTDGTMDLNTYVYDFADALLQSPADQAKHLCANYCSRYKDEQCSTCMINDEPESSIIEGNSPLSNADPKLINIIQKFGSVWGALQVVNAAPKLATVFVGIEDSEGMRGAYYRFDNAQIVTFDDDGQIIPMEISFYSFDTMIKHWMKLDNNLSSDAISVFYISDLLQVINSRLKQNLRIRPSDGSHETN